MPTFPPFTEAERERIEQERTADHELDRLVPFYKQSLDVTCGPAALMMAMAYFDPDTPLDRDLEIEIWREANLVEVWGTSREGLAIAAARRGFKVATQGDRSGLSFVDAIREDLPDIDEGALKFFYEDTRDRFDRMGLEDRSDPITEDALVAALDGGRLPAILTDASVLGEPEPVPHWVLVRGYTPEELVLNDPNAEGPGTRFDRSRADDLIGFDDVSCAVYVGARTRETRRPHP